MTATAAAPILTVSLSQIADLALKPLDWTKSLNGIDKPRYDASVFGRDYLVSQNDNNSWHFHAGNDYGSNKYRSAEEALTAAEDDYKAFVRNFLGLTIEALDIEGIVDFPEEPDDSSIRALFTLNSPVPRSTEEVRQVYTSLRNLAACPTVND